MVRIGIVGTGRIATRFVDEIVYVEGCAAELVYNPHIESAKRFAEKYGISKATDRWAEFIDEIDAVYIASPHDTHYGYAKKALLAGKHVLCEKPLTLRQAELEELFEIAEERKLVLMEALKTAYCPGYREVIQVAKSGAIGRICSVEAAFTRLTATNGREYNDPEFGGSFTEFGSYGLLPVIDLLGAEYSNLRFTSISAANGVDSFTKAELEYGDRGAEDSGGKNGTEEAPAAHGYEENGMITAFGTVKTGLGVKTEGQLLISGTNGYILVPSPWWLTRYFEVRFEDPNRVEKHVCEYAEAGLRYEIRAFCDQISSGKEQDRWGMKRSIHLASIMEAFLKKRKARWATEVRKRAVKIWAHRGLSMRYPENTLLAFRKAAELKGLTGIELDVQYSADHQIVVFHDEKVNRVTEGEGAVRDHTLQQLQALRFKNAEQFDPKEVYIPTMEEVLKLLKPYCLDNGLKINIELKTSVVRYEGIEKDTYELVRKYGLLNHIVWSSFLADSIRIIKELDRSAETGMLARSLEDCRRLGDAADCDAYHPWDGGLDVKLPEGKPVRAWNNDEPLYNSARKLKNFDKRELAAFGVTDLFTNRADAYLSMR